MTHGVLNRNSCPSENSFGVNSLAIFPLAPEGVGWFSEPSQERNKGARGLFEELLAPVELKNSICQLLEQDLETSSALRRSRNDISSRGEQIQRGN